MGLKSALDAQWLEFQRAHQATKDESSNSNAEPENSLITKSPPEGRLLDVCAILDLKGQKSDALPYKPNGRRRNITTMSCREVLSCVKWKIKAKDAILGFSTARARIDVD